SSADSCLQIINSVGRGFAEAIFSSCRDAGGTDQGRVPVGAVTAGSVLPLPAYSDFSLLKLSSTCGRNGLHVIRSNVAQIILCALLLIDAVIVIAEIILEIKAITSEKVALEGAFVKTASFVNETFANCLSERGLLLPEFTSACSRRRKRLASSMLNILLALGGHNSSSVCNVTGVATAVASAGSAAASSSPAAAAAAARSSTAGRPASATAAGLRLRRAASGGGSSGGGGGGGGSSGGGGGGVRIFSSYQQDYSHAKLLHDVSSVLHYVSIGILGLFVLEVALKVACLGRNFVREKFEIVDATVILISFVADIVFVKLESTEVSVMVLFLLCAHCRVINGLMMHEKQRDEFRIQLQKRARRMSEMKCDTLRQSARPS
uniref:Voltage-gated hydrogen channel 1 n=1 Tax=Macrostomum lignano TaxID=282301 RepID=A0A1I8F401_9PLAT